MNRRQACLIALALILLPALPRAGEARGLSVDVWTDRGDDAVFSPGDEIRIKVRASEDAYLLVYEIDAEGYVHELFPYDRSQGGVEGHRTYDLSRDRPDAQLVAEGPVGEGYIVAVASLDPFEKLPWYLRPADPKAEELGYEGGPDEERDQEGVTAEGRIVGDPFVAMERIRRQVLPDPDDGRSFASSYVSYYVGHPVRYPRYLCYDCHRSNYWAWWDGFDPYYAHCSVFDFRVNYQWYWGPTCWFGNVPYFVFAYRNDCPPQFRSPGRQWWSSWDGWNRWQGLWGGHLRRYKSPPPQGYVPPSKYDREFRRPLTRDLPPGFLGVTANDRLQRREVPVGRQVVDRGGRGVRERGWLEGDVRRRRDPGSTGENPDYRGRRGGERPVPQREQRGDDRPRNDAPAPAPRRERVERGGSSYAPPESRGAEPRREPERVERAPRADPPAREARPAPSSPRNGDDSPPPRQRR